MAQLIMQEEASAPTTPGSGKWTTYFKANGMYVKDDAGNEIGPIGNGGLPQGFIYGLTLSNNVSDATNDIDIATGKCRDITDAVDIALGSALTKRLDAAWAVGTNQGGLDTGSIANATYQVWRIKRSDTGVVDVLFSASASTPTMPANYDYKRRIGSIIRESGAIVGFIQNGDTFTRKIQIRSSIVTNQATTAVLITLNIPTGVILGAMITASMYDSTSTAQVDWLITDPALHRDFVFSIEALACLCYCYFGVSLLFVVLYRILCDRSCVFYFFDFGHFLEVRYREENAGVEVVCCAVLGDL